LTLAGGNDWIPLDPMEGTAMRREQPVESPYQASDLDGLSVCSVAFGVPEAAPASQPYAASSFSRRVVPDIAIRRSRRGGKMRYLTDCRSNSIHQQVH
jgi:hypothetical protein